MTTPTLDLSAANRRHVGAIAGRLSLRPPQRFSLEVLARVTEIVPLQKAKQDLDEALRAVRSEFGSVTSFERDFPSLAFALATGVGKTRLMGAFAAYLHRAHGVKHFFVLAPNLTIYDKLKEDFHPGTRKYVFQGLAEFAQTPPLVITGENYESSLSIRQQDIFGRDDRVHVNVFNISKLNKDAKSSKGSAPRIKRLSEYIGESYFDYLAGLDDLVLMMDESHRYRADAGVKALNELRPVLGLELTATPQVQSGTKTTPFQNVIYSYPLANAIQDGFVKEPAVATRQNFDASAHTEEQLERIKLEDGIRLHENTKTELDTYARQSGSARVKPFMLVVAKDTTHANDLLALIRSDAFMGGRYRDRVITVHSNQKGDEKEETIQRLLEVENPDEPTEIVIHVDKLKEGWDVTNLYTIVPLRAANSKTLIEQSIGRGLRLPFGKKTGVPEVDRLTIVSHDKFQEIVDAANDPDSILRTFAHIEIKVDQPGTKSVTIAPLALMGLTGTPGDGQPFDSLTPSPPSLPSPGQTGEESGSSGDISKDEQPFTPEQAQIAKMTLSVIEGLGGRIDDKPLPNAQALTYPDAQTAIFKQVREHAQSQQFAMGKSEKELDEEVKEIIAKVTSKVVEGTISLPRIVVEPSNDITITIDPFDLDTSAISFQPVDQNILIRELQAGRVSTIETQTGVAPEQQLKDHILRRLIDYPDVDYTSHDVLLHALCDQAVAHIRGYLDTEDEARNVVQYFEAQIAQNIHQQMQPHYRETATSYNVKVTRGYESLKSLHYTVPENAKLRHFNQPVHDKQKIKQMHFGGFKKCLYPVQKFDSDTERVLAQILEGDANVGKWYRPVHGQLSIYARNPETGKQGTYHPDFVAESENAKYLIETKARKDMKDGDVLSKKDAAQAWCRYATDHEQQHGGKPWRYLLIPHDEVNLNATLAVLDSKFGVS